MTKLVNGSRRFFLGMAFLSVMAGTGGFIGAIVGVILVLLSQVMLGAGTAMLALMPVGVILGTASSLTFSLLLMARQSLPFVWQPKLLPSSHADSK